MNNRTRLLQIRQYPITAALLLFGFLFIALACLAQTEFPDTPAGNQAKGWLEAFNAGDADKFKEFLRKNFPARLEQADRAMGFREMTGGLRLLCKHTNCSMRSTRKFSPPEKLIRPAVVNTHLGSGMK